MLSSAWSVPLCFLFNTLPIMLTCPHDIIRQIHTIGFFPFFAGEIEDFSIEESIAPEFWFPEGDALEGAWEWKNDIIIDGDCAYGKFYQGKACFVSMEWFPHLVNWRRSNHTPNADEQLILDTVKENGSMLSSEIKKRCGYVAPTRRRITNPVERLAAKDQPRPKAQRKGYDSTITRLQMACLLLSANFEYSYTRDGRRYGWSIARYCTPEDFFGEERLRVECSPEESKGILIQHLTEALPQATPNQIRHLVGC